MGMAYQWEGFFPRIRNTSNSCRENNGRAVLRRVFPAHRDHPGHSRFWENQLRKEVKKEAQPFSCTSKAHFPRRKLLTGELSSNLSLTAVTSGSPPASTRAYLKSVGGYAWVVGMVGFARTMGVMPAR